MHLTPYIAYLLAATVVTAGEPGLVSRATIWQLAHPESKALIGIDWQRLRDSAAGVEIRKQILQKAGPIDAFGDLLDSVDRVLISSPGQVAGTKKNAPLIVVARGRFDPAKLRRLAQKDGAVAKRYNEVEVLAPAKAGPNDLLVALIDPATVMFGDAVSVRAALDRASQAELEPAPSNAVFSKAIEFSARHDLWAVLQVPPGALAAKSKNSQAQADQLMRDIAGLEAGISLRDGLNLDANLNTVSEGAAGKLAATISGLGGFMLASAANEQGNFQQLAKALVVRADGRNVRLTLTLNQQQLLQSMQKARIPFGEKGPDMFGKVAAGGQTAPPPRGTIRIIGADNGPKEITY